MDQVAAREAQVAAREVLRRLDATSDGDVAELRDALNRLNPTHPGGLGDLLRIAHTATDDIVVALAKTTAACMLMDRGDEDDADELFRAGVAVLWDSGERGEVTALINYALLRLGRGHAYEALVLARRAVDAAPGNAPYAETLAHLYRAGACIHLRDWEAFDECVMDALATAPRLRPAQRNYLRKVSTSYRILVAFESGRRVDVEELMEALRGCDDVDPWGLLFHEAVAHLLAERPLDALRDLERLAQVTGPHERHEHDVSLIQIRALRALDDEDGALARAESLLDELDQRSRGALDAGEVMGRAITLATLLRSLNAGTSMVWRAYDLAGRAALARIADLDRLRDEIPQLTWIAPADTALLESHRDRLVAEHRTLLEVLGNLLADNMTEAPLIGANVAVGVCAWCNRVRGPDDVWLPLASFRVPPDVGGVTHGICPRCFDRALDSVRGAQV